MGFSVAITPAKFELVADQKSWDEAASRLSRERLIALDMESDGFFHYREKMSLIQVAAGGRIYLLDPLALKDLSALGVILGNVHVRKVLHGADYDLRSFDREYGFHFAGLYDTAEAIQLLNPEPMGLGRALASYLNIELKKPVKLQRSNWSRRPIPADALEYAAGDAAHLASLHDALEERLTSLGRGEWMAEECSIMERIRYEPPPPPEENAIEAKGTFDLDPKELAVFRELFLVRDRTAKTMDWPPFKVLSNEAMLVLARDPDQPLESVPRANRRFLREARNEVLSAIRKGRESPPITHPSKLKRRRNPWGEESRERWRAMQQVRKMKAAELGIAPSTLWPARSLDRMALEPGLCEEELRGTSAHGVRNWQRRVLGEALERALDGGVS